MLAARALAFSHTGEATIETHGFATQTTES
jgi:hypothetical protein